jgi:hypothetical protein
VTLAVISLERHKKNLGKFWRREKIQVVSGKVHKIQKPKMIAGFAARMD